MAQAACLLLNGLLGAGVLCLRGSVLLLALPDKGRLLEEPEIRKGKRFNKVNIGKMFTKSVIY